MLIILLTSIVSTCNQTKYVSFSNQNCKIQPTFINLPPNNIEKNFATIHLPLNDIDLLEVVLLLMTYLIKYVFQIKQKI